MSDANDDLVCPECGGPIGMTATYCMHCSADLTEDRDATPTADDGGWTATGGTEVSGEDATHDRDESVATPQDLPRELRASRGGLESPRLLPENFLLKAGTLVLAMAAGFAACLGSIVALTEVVGNDLAFVGGVVVWFAVTGSILRVTPA